jgi:hypothetical protein
LSEPSAFDALDVPQASGEDHEAGCVEWALTVRNVCNSAAYVTRRTLSQRSHSLPGFAERAALMLCFLLAFHAWYGQYSLHRVKSELNASISAMKSVSNDAWELARVVDDRISKVEGCGTSHHLGAITNGSLL